MTRPTTRRTTRLRMRAACAASVAGLLLAPTAAEAAGLERASLAETGSQFPMGLGIAAAIVLVAGIAAIVIARLRRRGQ